jgi:hypothetical protein
MSDQIVSRLSFESTLILSLLNKRVPEAMKAFVFFALFLKSMFKRPIKPT